MQTLFRYTKTKGEAYYEIIPRPTKEKNQFQAIWHISDMPFPVSFWENNAATAVIYCH